MGYYARYTGPIFASFWRTKKIAILYCVSAALGIGFLGAVLSLIARVHGGMGFHGVLVIALPLTGLLLFMSCAVTALELARQVFGEHRVSLFRVRRRGEIRVSASLLAVSVCVWMATLIVSLTVVLGFSRMAGLSVADSTNVMQFVALRLGGATLVATLLGLFIGKTMSRAAGYSLIVAILVFVSPIVSSIVASSIALDTSYLVRLVLYWTLTAPFELTAPMYGAALDSMYLIPSEPHQWLLPGIWVVSILIAFALSLRENHRASMVAAPLAFVLMIAPWAIHGAHIALPRMSHAPHDITDGSLMADRILEVEEGATPIHWFASDGSLMADHILEGASGSPSSSEPIPTVAKYKLDLSIGSMLSGKVTIVLDEPYQGKPIFTLFRGYRVKKITDGEGTSLDFLQEGDHVTILTPLHNEARKFVFEYSGSGWGNYANQQGVFLPGSFPWYPWPGEQHFYWFDDSFEFVVSPYIPRRGAVREIQVRVRSPFREIHTPQGVVLTRSDSFISVPTDSLTLMAGQVRVAGDEETFFIYGGKATVDAFEQPWNPDINILDRQTREKILDRARSLRQMMGLDNPERFDIDTVVLVPSYPGFSNLFDIPVYQDNYVLIDDSILVDYSVLFAMQGIPQSYAKRDVYEILHRYLSDPEDFLSLNPGTDAAKYAHFSSAVGNMFTDLVRAHGDEYVISQIVEYLMDEYQTESGEVFLSSLGGGEVESR